MLLVLAAVFALANSRATPSYPAALNLPLGVWASSIGLDAPLLHWISDGLMAVFFLLVG